MTHTNKQEVLSQIVDVIGQNVRTIKQHKGAVHELNIAIELSKVYERLNEVPDDGEDDSTLKELQEILNKKTNK